MPAAASLRPLVGYLQRLTSATVHAEATDRQLLESFTKTRDEAAFRALVQRHGPLVLGVCQRSLRHRHDAEDCFQATFLVLARKASAVHWHNSVAGWLHQVATRLAAELRVREARRRRREKHAAQLRPAQMAAEVRELGAILDEELHSLPEPYRAPLLLCCLQGRSRDQAAVQLGLTLRTLERRLQAGRNLLRERLTRRGLTLSAAWLAWGLAQENASAVPLALTVETSRVAVDCAVATPRVAVLAAHVLGAIFWQRVRGTAMLLLALGLLALGAGVGVQPSTAVPAAPRAELFVQADAPSKKPADLPKLREAGSARAVQNGLLWLVRQQTEAGGWTLEGAPPNDVAATAFGLLPLLGAADDFGGKRFGPHGDAVRRGLKALTRMQKDNGSFDGGMYAHALAAWALCEGYRLTGDAKLEQPAQRAIDYIVGAQHADGGWRYAPGQPGDTSVTSWQLLALKHGERAGLTVPAETFKKASAYLDSAASDERAAYSYVPRSPATPTMTAAGLMARHLLGWESRHPSLVKGATRLPPPSPQFAHCYYYHFATRAMRGLGGPEWDAWEAKLARLLIDRQEPDGGWGTRADPFGPAGGRLMVTSLSLLALEECGRLDAPAGNRAPKLKEGESAACWDDLAGGDLAQVRRAMQRLAAAPGQAVPLLRERLKAAPLPDPKRLARLIADLDDATFETRAQAFQELQDVAEAAEAPLRQALKSASSVEQRRRLEKLLEPLERGSQARLRRLRAVQVLELAGTAEARDLLRSIAEGQSGTALADAAREALERLAKR
jgi:RNA polymerase sigma factor (sigma-70 family)